MTALCRRLAKYKIEPTDAEPVLFMITKLEEAISEMNEKAEEGDPPLFYDFKYVDDEAKDSVMESVE